MCRISKALLLLIIFPNFTAVFVTWINVFAWIFISFHLDSCNLHVLIMIDGPSSKVHLLWHRVPDYFLLVSLTFIDLISLPLILSDTAIHVPRILDFSQITKSPFACTALKNECSTCKTNKKPWMDKRTKGWPIR